MNNITLNVEETDFVETYYRCVYFNLLTNSEFVVLAKLSRYPSVTAAVRKEIAKELGKSIYNVNNLIKKLHDRHVLIPDVEGLRVKVLPPKVSDIKLTINLKPKKI